MMCGTIVSLMRRCLTRPTQTVDTEGDVWNHCVTNEEVFNTANTNSTWILRVMCGTTVSPMRRCLTGPTQTVDTQGDVWNHCVTNEEVFNRANTNSGYSG